jgi:hypothetical protein
MPDDRDPQPTYHIAFRPAPGFGAPPPVRLRRLLKAALRSFGLRAVDLREEKARPVALDQGDGVEQETPPT